MLFGKLVVNLLIYYLKIKYKSLKKLVYFNFDVIIFKIFYFFLYKLSVFNFLVFLGYIGWKKNIL